MNVTKYCYNAFVGRLILTDAQNISLAVSLSLLIPMTVICNAAVIIALRRTKQLKSVANWNVAALCLSDCFGGLISLPMYSILFAAFGDKRICWYEQLTMLIAQTNSHFSAYMMSVIAIQRYLKARPTMAESLIAEKMFSKSGTKWTCSLMFFLSFIHGTVSTNFLGYSTNKVPNIIMMIINIFIVLTVYICYIQLFRGVKVHIADTAILNAANSSNQNSTQINPSQPMYYNELAKTMSFILASFAVCSVPYLVTDFFTGWYSLVKKENAPQTLRYLYYLSIWPISLNTIINALILLYRNKKAANYIKSHMPSSFFRTSTTAIQSTTEKG